MWWRRRRWRRRAVQTQIRLHHRKAEVALRGISRRPPAHKHVERRCTRHLERRDRAERVRRRTGRVGREVERRVHVVGRHRVQRLRWKEGAALQRRRGGQAQATRTQHRVQLIHRVAVVQLAVCVEEGHVEALERRHLLVRAGGDEAHRELPRTHRRRRPVRALRRHRVDGRAGRAGRCQDAVPDARKRVKPQRLARTCRLWADIRDGDALTVLGGRLRHGDEQVECLSVV